MEFGYIRVSTALQNEERQKEALREAGISERNTYIDKRSGKDFKRPQWELMVSLLRKGDIVYVESLDRLGRNYQEILKQWKEITQEIGADIVILDMPLLDTRNKKDLTGVLISDIILQLLSYVAEKERESIRTRQAEGIEIAKRLGKYQGRTEREVDTKKFKELHDKLDEGLITVKYIIKELGISEQTYYRRLRDMKAGRGQFADENRGTEKNGIIKE